MPRSSMHTTPTISWGSHAPLLGRCLLCLIGLAWMAPVSAQMPRDFHACLLFTAEDASAVLGGPAETEQVKGKPAKTATQCTYLRQENGKSLSATASFRFFRSPAEALSTLKESRLEVRGRPLIISGQDAYWHPKAGHLVVAKGNSVVVLQVGSAADNEREPEPARKAAERLLPRMGG